MFTFPSVQLDYNTRLVDYRKLVLFVLLDGKLLHDCFTTHVIVSAVISCPPGVGTYVQRIIMRVGCLAWVGRCNSNNNNNQPFRRPQIVFRQTSTCPKNNQIKIV